ncbi:phosrestin-2 isoform X2 [Nasonia vitripennis]|uniref:Arrestin C-terminal-like domain-containing protein n=1 Tax=Nasonia vitripennis TaxID=7425 RepID=A0A7M7QWR0_NASVI|nr:phosrestin-2 [Nasonia vitripennis]XP_032455694.1 phosrestin-2 isoform X2 [Nasonia vitripennis]
MVVNFKVFKKCSPNGKIAVYLGKRDFIDYLSGVEPVDGVVLLDPGYIDTQRKIWVQLICSFRYGREEDEVMGLNFQKELYLASEQLYPRVKKMEQNLTKLQERLLRKLGPNAVPFTFEFPQSAPSSVTLQPGADETGEPCGVTYTVKVYAGETETDITHKRSTVSMGIRKIQYAPTKQGRQPCTVVRKDFLLSPGELELEVTLDKQLYHHGERIAVSVCVKNNSNKVVKKIKALVQQGIDVVIFQNGQFRTVIDAVETQDGCPINPGSNLQKVLYLKPQLEGNRQRRGIALDGQIKGDVGELASSTLLTSPDVRDTFGIVVSYAVKVKLYLGALGGELSAELPFILMRQKPTDRFKLVTADENMAIEDIPSEEKGKENYAS